MNSDLETKVLSKGGGYSVELITEKDTTPKRFYYRKCGMEVGPWPYDLRSQRHYLSKGFLLEPPEKVEPSLPVYPCQICRKNHDSLGGLIDCLNKHKEV